VTFDVDVGVVVEFVGQGHIDHRSRRRKKMFFFGKRESEILKSSRPQNGISIDSAAFCPARTPVCPAHTDTPTTLCATSVAICHVCALLAGDGA